MIFLIFQNWAVYIFFEATDIELNFHFVLLDFGMFQIII